MRTIDLNCDLGESFGCYSLGRDEEIVPYVSSVNIACGWHAGDPMVMDKTIKLAKTHGVSIGAHPGFMDLIGFGRRTVEIAPESLKNDMVYQLGALMGFAKANGTKVQHLKPHGALYNMAAKDAQMAKAIAEAIASVDSNIHLMGLAGSTLIAEGNAAGLKTISEVFADRAYDAFGQLVPRTVDGAVLHDKDIVIARILKMVKEGVVTSIEGTEVTIKTESICVHGDTPEAVTFVREIKNMLENNNIKVAASVL